VVEVPTNRPVARIDDHDAVYRTVREKYEGVVKSIHEAHAKGQPILVGTTSIEKSELLSGLLKEAGIPHSVLNARQHEQEAQIVADAGKLGSVTIATNMAGRGTDIKLGGNVEFKVMEALAANPEAHPDEVRAQIEAEHKGAEEAVKAAGGLFVLGTERHESRRIDNQLRGRGGRQGDPGRSKFFLSLQDDLMRIFGSDRMDSMLVKLGLKEDEAIVHPWINKALEKAQQKVEARNFDTRKNILKYDNVMNDQRKVVFEQRREMMAQESLEETVGNMRANAIDELVGRHMPKDSYPETWAVADLVQDIQELLSLDLPIADWAKEEGIGSEEMAERIHAAADSAYAARIEKNTPDVMRYIEKQIVLQVLDHFWREHLVMLDHLRQVIGWRGYAQRDPLNEYKSEAFDLFNTLINRWHEVTTQQLMRVEIAFDQSAEPAAMTLEDQQAIAAINAQIDAGALSPASLGFAPAPQDAQGARDPNAPATWGRVGRNEDCPCGSGKKFKHCHGALV
jgi:preprotein translocase subunit SecA